MSRDDRFTATPRLAACKECGQPIYWAKMVGGKSDGKWWTVDAEPVFTDPLPKVAVTLTYDSKNGLISGRRVSKQSEVPDGGFVRTAHFSTCSARPPYDPKNPGPKRQAKQATLPIKDDAPEGDGGETKTVLDPDIPF